LTGTDDTLRRRSRKRG